MAEVKALADIAARQTTVADADLFFVESGGVPAGITHENMKLQIPGRLLSIETVTAVGLTNVTPPTGARLAYVEAYGTGGNGGAADSDTDGVSGDAAAAAGGTSASGCRILIDVSAVGWNVDCTIGARGTLGIANNGSETEGTDAADSTFVTSDGVEITIPGGIVGANSYDQIGAGAGARNQTSLPAAASVDVGSVEWFEALTASLGRPGWISPANATNAGSGALGGDGGSIAGASAAGRLANAAVGAQAGVDGPSPGSGGSGAATKGAQFAQQGGYGALGQFKFWWFS